MNNTPTVADLTWLEVQAHIDNGCKIAIVPFGHTEQHGPHLPLGSDSYFISAVTKMGAELAMKESGKPTALVFPVLPYGNGGKFANGELRLRPSTFIAIFVDLMKELEEQGFTKVVFASGHGANSSVMGNGVNEAYRLGAKIDAYIISPPAFMRKTIDDVLETDEWGHACEYETSTSLYLFPELVHLDRVESDEEEPEYDVAFDKVQAVRDGVVTHFVPAARQVSKEMPGYYGNPKKSTEEKGEKLVNAYTRGLADFLLELDKS